MTQHFENQGNFHEAKMEIFVEECQEVIQAIDSKWHQWKVNQMDLELLGEIRRCFHTLKGSGRMVDAVEVAELAWGVENMLNKVLRGDLGISDTMVGVVGNARNLMLAMIDNYHKGQAPLGPDMDFDSLQEQIDAVSRGQTIQQQIIAPASERPSPEIEDRAVADDPKEDLIDIIRRVDVCMSSADEALHESRKLSDKLADLQIGTQDLVSKADLQEHRRQVQALAKELQKLRQVAKNNVAQMAKHAEESRRSMLIIAGSFSTASFFLALLVGLFLG